jgi:hypothetical protein
MKNTNATTSLKKTRYSIIEEASSNLKKHPISSLLWWKFRCVKSATTSWGYEDGPWKRPGPSLLGAADFSKLQK